MNEGGMAMYLGMAVDIGEEVEVEFAPRNAGLSLRVGGIVRSRSGCTHGIEFMPAEGRETQVVAALRDFLRKRDGDAHTFPDWLSTTAT
jgi:hypothetical protein